MIETNGQGNGYLYNMNKKFKKKTSHKCFLISNTILALVLIGMGLVWATAMFDTSRGGGKSNCAASHFFNDVKGGVKDDKLTFGGINGLLYLFGKFTKEVGTLETNTIPELGLTDMAEKLNDNMDTFYTTYKDYKIDSCNPKSPEGTKITTDLSQNMEEGINDDIDY